MVFGDDDPVHGLRIAKAERVFIAQVKDLSKAGLTLRGQENYAAPVNKIPGLLVVSSRTAFFTLPLMTAFSSLAFVPGFSRHRLNPQP